MNRNTFADQKLTRADWETALQPYRMRGGYRCPAHDDRNPSLGFSAQYDTPHCFVGCDLADIRAVLFGDRPAPAPQARWPATPGAFGRARRPSPLPTAGRWWHYQTGDGAAAFAVQRLDLADGGKTFRQWTPDADRPGLWNASGPTGKRPMYRLPTLLADPGPVWITEGEKCADAGNDAWPGRMFTTWAGGAGNWHQTDWLPLAGRPCTLLADSDAAGHAAMIGLAEHLARLGCALTLVMGPLDKTDVADWLAIGGIEYADRQIAEHSGARISELTATAATDYVGCVTRGSDSRTVTQPTYFQRPDVPGDLRCLAMGATHGFTTLPNAAGKVLHLPCGKCEHCREWRRRLIARRYGLGKRTIKNALLVNQTMIRVAGFGGDDYTLPVAYAESLRRRIGGKRLRLLRRDDGYLPELVIIYDSELDARTIELIRDDMTRKGLAGSVAVGPVTSAMVYALIDAEPTRVGTRRNSERQPGDPDTIARETAHFTDWPKWDEPAHDYIYGDIAVTTADPNPPDATPIDPLEKSLLRLPLADRSIRAVAMRMEGQTLNRGLFDALALAVADGDRSAGTEIIAAIHQTTGPVVSRQLLTDVAEWLADPEGVRWRDCWRPVTDAVGIKAPDPTCLQCGWQTPAVTALNLCVRCDLVGGA